MIVKLKPKDYEKFRSFKILYGRKILHYRRCYGDWNINKDEAEFVLANSNLFEYADVERSCVKASICPSCNVVDNFKKEIDSLKKEVDFWKVKAQEVSSKPEYEKPSKPLEKMSKDELLDLTALEGVEADYRMTVKKLIQILKDHYENKKK